MTSNDSTVQFLVAIEQREISIEFEDPCTLSGQSANAKCNGLYGARPTGVERQLGGAGPSLIVHDRPLLSR